MSAGSAARSCRRIAFCERRHPRLRPLRCPTFWLLIEAARLLLPVFAENRLLRIRACLSIRSSPRRTLLLRAVRQATRSAQKLLRVIPAAPAVFFHLPCVRLQFAKDTPRKRADRGARGKRRSIRCFFLEKVLVPVGWRSQNCRDAASS